MRRFNANDLDTVNSWYMARGMRVMEPDELPAVGFYEPGVAAGFVYQTDSSIALLEGYVTNPDADPVVRDGALDSITLALMRAARNAGKRHIVGLCQDPHIEARANKHGMASIGTYALVSKGV